MALREAQRGPSLPPRHRAAGYPIARGHVLRGDVYHVARSCGKASGYV